MSICNEGPRWLGTASVNDYKLTCLYDNITRINVTEASLNFVKDTSIADWNNQDFEHYDCDDEFLADLRLNFTYTIQRACDANKTQLVLPDGWSGLECAIDKEFLRSNIFRLNRYVMATYSDIFPLPFSMHITYACIWRKLIKTRATIQEERMRGTRNFKQIKYVKMHHVASSKSLFILTICVKKWPERVVNIYMCAVRVYVKM